MTLDDFAGTTVSLTNPGTIGTLHSVPRLMPGQGVIVGVGAITYPPEYEGADPQTLAEIGISKTVTLTSTYDHRIIQGAESGEFLAKLHDLLLGGDEFYDDIFASFGVPYEPARWSPDRSPVEGSVEAQDKIIAVQQLINMYRVRGHLIANLDPLGLKEPRTHKELDPNHWGLTIWDLDREFPTGGLAGRDTMKLRDILGVLRDAYARTIGVEYMHIQEPDQKAWIQQKVEGVHGDTSADDKRRILSALNGAEAFERFLHTKFLGQKRFSLEGAETLIPMLDFLIDGAADAGVEDVVMGMAHRGRLNVLANVVGKSYEQIFREFEGELDPSVPQGSGDVKYHVGATGKFTSASGHVDRHHPRREPEPPRSGRPRRRRHGAGQAGSARRRRPRPGVVGAHPRRRRVRGARRGRGDAEPLRAPRLRRRRHGAHRRQQPGRVHHHTRVRTLDRARHRHRQGGAGADLPRERRRSGSVRADDPAGARVPQRLQEGRRRRHGLLPALRAQRERRARVHAAAHVRGHRQSAFDPQALHGAAREPRRPHARGRRARARRLPRRGMEEAFDETKTSVRPPATVGALAPEPTPSHIDTGVPRERLDQIVDALTIFPDGFEPHPKLARILANRRTAFDSDQVDWALGEALAFGSLLLEGTPVRVAGQDTRRGTFSQRHATIVDHRTEQEYTPLAHLGDDAAPFMIYDSVLSEFAALGFEYGYSVADHDALGVLGSAVRRLRQRRADDHRPVHRRGRGQVGSAQRPGACCCRTVSKGRDPSTRRRGSSASSCCARRTTSASSTPPPRRSTSTCCGARCTTPPASRSSS